MNVPDWIVQEVGRLHLHSLALERELNRLRAERPDVPDTDDPEPPSDPRNEDAPR